MTSRRLLQSISHIRKRTFWRGASSFVSEAKIRAVYSVLKKWKRGQVISRVEKLAVKAKKWTEEGYLERVEVADCEANCASAKVHGNPEDLCRNHSYKMSRSTSNRCLSEIQEAAAQEGGTRREATLPSWTSQTRSAPSGYLAFGMRPGLFQ